MGYYFGVLPRSNDHGNVSLNNSHFYVNKTVELTVTPDDGYEVANVIIKDDKGQNINYDKSYNKYTFTMPASPAYYYITYRALNFRYCKTVKGNGTKLGDEIACDTEHFYVISNDGTNIRMLAKYNLYTGLTIYKVPLPEGTNYTASEAYYECRRIASQNGGVLISDEFYNVEGYCFYGKLIDDTVLRQNEEAKSAHWDEDLNYLYPQVGDVYQHINSGYYDPEGFIASTTEVVPGSYFYDLDLKQDYFKDNTTDERYPSSGELKFNTYRLQLRDMGYNVKHIDLLKVSELDDIAYQISGEHLPLVQWGADIRSSQILYMGNNSDYNRFVFGDLKPYLTKDYSWLYSTTYWNGTRFRYAETPPTYTSPYMHVFTAQQGKLCGAGFAACAPMTLLGCGLRPVVTIPSTLSYIIRTETDGKGELRVKDTSLGDEDITFEVVTHDQYVLKTLTITSDSGESITFTENDMTQNEDGTITINRNNFRMPFDNVTIVAGWEEAEEPEINPQTEDMILVSFGILTLSIIGLVLIINKKRLFE